MQTQVNTSEHTSEMSGGAALRMIPLTELDPPPTNTRKYFKEESLEDLTESIRLHGVLQPILVREVEAHGAGGARYQIIAGERRFRAARRAGLSEIPAHVRSLSDTEALSAQIVENLQREDVHPLDEADGLLRLREVAKLEISDIARRVAKDARYITRRLALTGLIEEARSDFRKDLITLAHALEVCRLAPEIQKEALAACYERKTIWNQKDQTHQYVPDKDRPARHVKYLQEWLAQNVYLNLHKAPFKMDDARLRSDGLTCVECPQRTGRNTGLFDDIKNTDTCLNPQCFQAKIRAFVRIKKAELDQKSGRPAAYISPYYDSRRDGNRALSMSEYHLLERKADRCQHAEQAICADGPEIGHVRWICREKTCKDHLGRVANSYSFSNGGSRGPSPEDRNKRKQELFDIKVDEVVRKRVLKEAVNTYSWPLERKHLNEVVKEFFRRIPSDDQKTICEVFGWGDDAASKLRFNDDAVLGELEKLDQDRLAQFMMLCSFAHYGANSYKNHRVDQTAVVRLSKERGTNHTLIDAQARAELCAKKYRAAHQAYLNAVTKGEAAEKPVVHERPQEATLNIKAAKKKARAIPTSGEREETPASASSQEAKAATSKAA
jgi:ParB family chromosome partitioning protein